MAEVADESQYIGTKNMGKQDDLFPFTVVVDCEDVDLGAFVSRETAADTGWKPVLSQPLQVWKTYFGGIIARFIDVNAVENQIVRRIDAFDLEFGRFVFL